MSPTLSIITVCYNAERSIARTLRSVAAQDFSDFEYLIIDGASRDNTLGLVQEIYPQAVVLSEPDSGIYDAMNKGLKRAAGRYVMFLNAGDALWDAHTLTNTFTGNTEVDIIYGDTMIVDAEGHELGLRRLRPPKELTWKSFSDGMLVCHQAFIVRRELAPDYNLQYRFSADFDWCIRSLLKANGCRLVGSPPLVRYLNEGITTQNRYRSLWERFRIMSRHYGLAKATAKHITFFFRWKR